MQREWSVRPRAISAGKIDFGGSDGSAGWDIIANVEINQRLTRIGVVRCGVESGRVSVPGWGALANAGVGPVSVKFELMVIGSSLRRC